MKQTITRLYFFISLIFLTVLQVHSQVVLDGNWVGGTSIAGSPKFVQARFAGTGNSTAGSIDIPSMNAMRLPILKISNDQSAVQFQIDSPYGLFAFDGKMTAGVIQGKLVSTSGMKGDLHLVKATKISRKSFDDYAGSYRNSNNQNVLITYNPFDQLSVLITEAGGNEPVTRNVFLIPASENSFFTSRSAIAPPADKDEIVTFVRNEKGAVTGLEWEQPDGKKMSAQKFAESYRQESVNFQNGSIHLGGTLFLPVSEGKHPAMVVGHGGGPQTRDSAPIFLRARQFASMGYAVLVYDKRGTGDASGSPWSGATFDDLAGDMLAGIDFLKKRSDIDAKRIGLQGNSQAGWTVPLAAVRSKDVRFVIIASGGGITNADTDVHEARMYIRENKLSTDDADELLSFVKAKWNYALTGNGWEEYEAALKKAQNKAWLANFGGAPVKNLDAWSKMGLRKDRDLESEKTIGQIKVPILLLYGNAELDDKVPVKESMTAWERALKKSGHTDYMIRQFNGVGHALFLGIANNKTILNTEAFDTVKIWLRSHRL